MELIPVHQECLFEKLLGPLSDYHICKLRMQQWALSGHLTPIMEHRIRKQMEGYENKIKEILEIEE